MNDPLSIFLSVMDSMYLVNSILQNKSVMKNFIFCAVPTGELHLGTYLCNAKKLLFFHTYAIRVWRDRHAWILLFSSILFLHFQKIEILNPYVPNGTFLYPVKISENLTIIILSGDGERVNWERMGWFPKWVNIQTWISDMQVLLYRN